jgi:hypothetical protein
MAETPIEAYPLCWPPTRPRSKRKDDSALRAPFAKSRDFIVGEVRRLGGQRLVVSTNIPLRRDGLPYAATSEPDDAGVAVYFTYKGKQMCFACDRWRKVASNMQAIAKTIEALRGVARWGTGDMMEAAFTGFAALPPPMAAGKPWRDVLGVQANESGEQVVKEAYRRKRGEAHPDRQGGSDTAFLAVQAAYEQAARELGFAA